MKGFQHRHDVLAGTILGPKPSSAPWLAHAPRSSSVELALDHDRSLALSILHARHQSWATWTDDRFFGNPPGYESDYAGSRTDDDVGSETDVEVSETSRAVWR